jgi:hypothetical protein
MVVPQTDWPSGDSSIGGAELGSFATGCSSTEGASIIEPRVCSAAFGKFERVRTIRCVGRARGKSRGLGEPMTGPIVAKGASASLSGPS